MRDRKIRLGRETLRQLASLEEHRLYGGRDLTQTNCESCPGISCRFTQDCPTLDC